MALFKILFKNNKNKITTADEAQKLMEEDILKNNIRKILILEDQDITYYGDGAYLIKDKDLEQKAVSQSKNKGITRDQVSKQLQDQKDWDGKFLLKSGEKSPWDVINEDKEEKMGASDIELCYAYIKQLLTNKNIKSKMRYDNEVIQIFVDKNTSPKDIYKLLKSTKTLNNLSLEAEDKEIGITTKYKNIKIAIFNDESSKFAKDFNKRKEMDGNRVSNLWKALSNKITFKHVDANDALETASQIGGWVVNKLQKAGK